MNIEQNQFVYEQRYDAALTKAKKPFSVEEGKSRAKKKVCFCQKCVHLKKTNWAPPGLLYMSHHLKKKGSDSKTKAPNDQILGKPQVSMVNIGSFFLRFVSIRHSVSRRFE